MDNIFDNMVVIHTIKKHKKEPVKKTGNIKSNTSRHLTIRSLIKSKINNFYNRINIVFRKSKPAIKFLNIYITFSSFFKLILNIAVLSICPDISMIYILYT